MWEEIRKDGDLAYLDRQLFPRWPGRVAATAPADGDPGYRKGIYFCECILQLMENVFLDLHFDLDTEWEHSDNQDRKSTRLNSSHIQKSRMPSSA